MGQSIDSGDRLEALRRGIAAIEGRPVVAMPAGGIRTASVSTGSGAVLDFGLPAIDRHLGSARGMAFGAIHEVVGAEARDVGAVFGFSAALISRLLERRGGRVVWITTAEARREGGGLYAPGLTAFGLDPGRLIEVATERPEEALWASEEALSCRGVAAVVMEIPGRSAVLDLTATRRLALRAGAGEGLGFGLLLRAGGQAQTTAAATRWRVTRSPSRPIGGFARGLGRAAFRLDLEKNRDGRIGRFDIEWDGHDRRFLALPPYPGSVSSPASDRSAASSERGRILAFERGGGR